ncbi:MAG: phosphatase PAP2 family protein [Mesorhizobium sp.]
MLAIVATIALFTLAPQLDIATSEFFERPNTNPEWRRHWSCGAFAFGCHPILSPLREALHALPLILAGLLLVATLWLAWRRRSFIETQVLQMAAGFWAFVFGGMFLVDAVSKTLFARPRPYHLQIDIERFDDHRFIAPGQWGGACESNCSFPSGEAFALGWVVCATVLLPARYRQAAFAVALPLAIFGSLLRVVFGAHFLSDVIVGALLAVLTFSLCQIAAAAIDRRAKLR